MNTSIDLASVFLNVPVMTAVFGQSALADAS
jgi:hypothetical protein